MSDLDTRIDAALAPMDAGRPVDALAAVAAILVEHPDQPRPYRAAARALAAAAGDPALAGMDGKDTLFRALILQPDCAERPLIFHHALAGQLTSGNGTVVSRVADEIRPALKALWAENPEKQALILLLLVVRSVLGDWPGLRERHLAAFPKFTADDLALPYSVMFDAAAFGVNGDEVLARYGPDRIDGLAPHHLLQLEWLGARLFSRPDNADLAIALADPGDEAGRAAARSLIVRHWQPGGVITNDWLTARGLDPALLDTARDRLPEGAPGAPARRLESRPWMAFRAATPFLSLGRKPKVAVSVSGQLRGFRTAFPTWRGFLRGAEADIFVHTWADMGRAGAQPHRAVLPFAGAGFAQAWRRIGAREGYEAMAARYPTLIAALKDGSQVAEGELAAFYGAQRVVVDDEGDARFANFSNQDKMHWKIGAAFALAGGDYDLYVRIRPDLTLRARGFSWADMVAAAGAEPAIWCDRAFGAHYGNPAVGDQLAIGARAAMAAYAATHDRHEGLAGLGLAAFPAEGPRGHVSLAQTCWLRGIRAARVPMRLGTLVDPAPLSVAETLAALRADAGARADAMDAELIRAAEADVAARAG